MLLGGGNDPFFQHVEGVLQNVGDVPCSTRIDHVGIAFSVIGGVPKAVRLEHDPEKWEPVFRKDHLHQKFRAPNETL